MRAPKHPPLYLNPLAVAWRAVNPRTKFPECLETPGATSDASADVPPIDVAKVTERQQRQRAAVRRYQERVRLARQQQVAA
jgi:hypothetical protein